MLRFLCIGTAALTGVALSLSMSAAHAEDAHGNVRYIGDGSVILGDGTRYKLPEDGKMPKLKEGQHVTIQFKKGHNRNEVTHMRVDD
jgi:Spy/CpxP family protein refolding chaperone